MSDQDKQFPVTIGVSENELLAIRTYLTTLRHHGGPLRSILDGNEKIERVLRRLGTEAASEGLYPDFRRTPPPRTPETCQVCGCTETDACRPPCSWYDTELRAGRALHTVCNACGQA